MRNREIYTWVLIPLAIALVVISIPLSFSDNVTVAVMANIIGSGIFIGWWRARKKANK